MSSIPHLRWVHVTDGTWTGPGRTIAHVNARVRQVGLVRFCRADGMDPRVSPEPGGTHMSSGLFGGATRDPDSPYAKATACGLGTISGLLSDEGFTDFGPFDAVDCPSCAAQLAAWLLTESGIG